MEKDRKKHKLAKEKKGEEEESKKRQRKMEAVFRSV